MIRQRPNRRCNRRGMTLLEVFIALAIFIGAMAVISQIISTGSRAAVSAQLQSEAVLRAETRMAEAVAGAISLQSAQGSFEDDPAWGWTLSVASGPQTDTLQVTVVATHSLPSGIVNGQVALTRLVRDPQVFLDAASSATTSGLELLQ